MFIRASLPVRRPPAFVALLATVMFGLGIALPLMGVPMAQASHGAPGDATGKVAGVTVTGDQENPGNIDVAWDAATPEAAPITDYIVFVENTADETDYRTATVTTSGPNPSPGELECSIGSLRSGATYDVQMRARNLIGERGPWSDTVQITLAGG